MTQTSRSKRPRIREAFLNYLMLFGSMGTLVCCALPALLVSLGLGAVMAGMASNIPGLVWLSAHKEGMFIFAGSMLALNGLILWQSRNALCPIDPELREICIKGRYTSKGIYFFSLGVFTIGAFFAYAAPSLL